MLSDKEIQQMERAGKTNRERLLLEELKSAYRKISQLKEENLRLRKSS